MGEGFIFERKSDIVDINSGDMDEIDRALKGISMSALIKLNEIRLIAPHLTLDQLLQIT